MIGPPVDDASCGPPGWRLYRSGPWLVVHGSGPDSEDAAIQIREQCITRGIDIVLHPIDEASGSALTTSSASSWCCPRS